MIIDKKQRQKRRAISGIIATVILFAMLFTVGSSYFLYVNQNDMLYSQASSNRASAIVSQQLENIMISTTAPAPANDILFSVNNVGGIGVNITAVYVLNATSGKVHEFFQPGTTGITPALPIAVNVGAVSSAVNTGQLYVGGKNYVIKLVTQRGNTFTATYPPTATTLAAQALSSGAIGDLYLSHSSYSWYTIGSCGTSQCLTKVGKAFAIPYAVATTANIAFSVTVTDLNPNQYPITLDEYTQLYQIVVPVNLKASSYKTNNWYIVSVQNGTYTDMVQNSYSQITLPYNVPDTLFFGSLNAGSFSATSALNAVQDTGILVFILSHGCEPGGGSCIATLSNYGQNMPYVSTIYY